jgi:hypothetical protein
MIRSALLFCVASAAGISGCAQGGAAADVKNPPAPEATANPTTQNPANTPEAPKPPPVVDTPPAPKGNTPLTTQDWAKYVLGIQGKIGTLSAFEKSTGLDFEYDPERNDTELKVKDGAQEVTIALGLTKAPRIVVGTWGRSEADRSHDPEITRMRIRSEANIAPPVSKDGKEILFDPIGKREVWAWDRFFYYYPKAEVDWYLAWQKDREHFHHSQADVTKIREVLTAVAKTMNTPGFSFFGYFTKNHAAAAVKGKANSFDFRSAEVSVEGKSMDVHFLNETQIAGFFNALGIQKVGFSFKHDAGYDPVPVKVRGCEVTVVRGTWPDGSAKDGPTSTLRVNHISVKCE